MSRANCSECGKETESVKGICLDCDLKTIGDPLMFIADFHDEYYDHALGQVVTSRQHRARLMKEKGLFEVGNEWKYIDPARNRAIREREIDKQIDSLNKEAYQMLSRG